MISQASLPSGVSPTTPSAWTSANRPACREQHPRRLTRRRHDIDTPRPGTNLCEPVSDRYLVIRELHLLSPALAVEVTTMVRFPQHGRKESVRHRRSEARDCELGELWRVASEVAVDQDARPPLNAHQGLAGVICGDSILRSRIAECILGLCYRSPMPSDRQL